MDSSTTLSPEMGTSRSSRPASAAVAYQPSASSSSRKRASHQVTTQQPEEPTPTHDVYSHPHAQAYLAAHPKRTIPRFGPYLLLQTLGEGEFGKVKLGLHHQWGEEVAVKLIRRAGVDNTVRMSKVSREIEVLRTIQHPNIVHLYDVIETDKYIGIILEYASGGELFDHILAHRYLKEKDACKLFAQLISGVAYIHAKKIVHRDLKLENLLLDRNRNVIITDFGFANRFEDRPDDLMQTSCGSPCYAAPELVISEGLYVGSAVDIWSCGVILYAMLAGYLPFDDDPANPDGDNINLLYKYIISTSLTFPDYVSLEARDLLSKMLVPDPNKRADLSVIMSHVWLQPYAYLFHRTVEEMEALTLEQQRQKRLHYQKQMRPAENAGKMTRSHSSAVPSSAATSRRGMSPGGESAYDTSMDQEAMYSTRQPQSSRRAAASAIVMPTAPSALDDPFVIDAPSPARETIAEASSPSEPSQSPRSRRSSSKETSKPSKKPSAAASTDLLPVARSPGQDSVSRRNTARHTIQVEYAKPTEDDANESIATGIYVGDAVAPPSAPANTPTTTPKKRTAAPEQEERTPRKTAPSPSPTERTPRKTTTSSPAPVVTSSMSTSTSSKVSPSSPTSAPRAVNGRSSATRVDRATPPSSFSRGSAAKLSNLANEKAPSPTHVTPPPQPQPRPPQVIQTPGPASTELRVVTSDSSDSASSSKRHRRGLSVDKLGFGKLLNGHSDNESSSRAVNGYDPKRATLQTPLPSGYSSRTASLAAESNDSTATGTSTLPSAPEEESLAEKKKSRRKTALSLMVEPLRSKTMRGYKRSSATVEPESEKANNASRQQAPPMSATVQSTTTPVNASFLNTVQRPGAKAPLSASTTKAQKVMNWFHRGSSVRVGNKVDPVVDIQPEEDRSTTPTLDSYRNNQAALSSTSTINHPSISKQLNGTEGQSQKSGTTPSSWKGQRSASSGDTSKGIAGRARDTLSHVAAAMPKGGHSKGYDKKAMRVHHGAVDQGTVTTGAPPEVFAQVTKVLLTMGLELQKETEYKYRCIRPKQRKPAVGLGFADPASPTLGAFAVSGTAASNGVDKRGLPVPSQSTGMFRGLLSRRQSQQAASGAALSPETHDPSPSSSSAGHLSPEMGSPLPSTNGEPLYGDKHVDQGDEVRFSVELTRMDRLDDTFSLDIRRLKGNLRSYKFLYDTLRERCNFPQ
ncbi:Pkinase-domain-containing protein [Sistotremastrum suecicum HHB10207 ss-3]|uniref:Pkinase-domain-containing protein n=1 Tax=Sistotremastrum suecicum HHB10207 ss-3 TaxID=1314776 RepID=A0A166EPF0_9AGAM|nr:Pkinase-domain-containing protein [Sistotremastrum suecicum HHB10207 ss-3]